MQSTIAEQLGIDPEIFHWLIIPLFIFTARICDVSINTIRVIFMLGGKRYLATLLGFFEAAIWLMAISQILQNIGSLASYFAYAGGFATGIFVGMKIEEKLAIGKVIVRIITPKNALPLIEVLREKGYGVTYIDAFGSAGPVNIIFTVANRKTLKELHNLINEYNPGAFYTVEGVKYVSKNYEMPDEPGMVRRLIGSVIRK
jgi:uncharacterized protein YebE (UPF0316 family)